MYYIGEIWVIYNNEKFEDKDNLGNDYDDKEKPLTINPEKDDISEDIKFHKDGRIYSENPRVSHTINNVCKLNRDELVQHRICILNDFINHFTSQLEFYLKYKDVSILLSTVRIFIQNCKIENEYYSFRKYILTHLDIFTEDKLLVKIINKMGI